ncbi:unnamed protein product, partial [Amoebophrya sp. A25]
GDCSEDLDPVISKRVFRIQGTISANNYVEVPKTLTKSLGLTGEYIYIQLRSIGSKFFHVHLDFSVADRNMLERISLTNMQSEPKAQSRQARASSLILQSWICSPRTRPIYLLSQLIHSLRLWFAGKNAMPRCYTMLSCPSLLLVKALTFDPLSKYVAIAGLDTQKRQQIFVWDISRLTKGGSATLCGRQMSDWDLNALHFSPYEDLKLLSCGKENIRFWRLKDAHLPGQSVTLNSLARGTMFVDLCFEANRAAAGTGFLGEESLGYNHKVFVATAQGEVCVVSYRERSVLMLHKLHSTPIVAIAATESFCVTAAEDRYIRVCPLDFQCFVLHCMHEATPKGLDLTPDGSRVLSYTADGTIGVLDMNTQAFDVVHRSHASQIADAAASVLYEELVTVTKDGFIKIWNLNTMRQHTEFFSGTDSPCCVGCHPKKHLIAVGFESGTLRLFDVDGPNVLCEFVNFRLPIKSLAFAETDTANQSVIITCDSKGSIVLYDEEQNFQPSRNPDLFSGVQEPPPANCAFFKLANSHRLLLKYYDTRTLALFSFKEL